MKSSTIFFGALLCALSLWCWPGQARGDELPPLPVQPSATKVLIVPALDETGDRAEMQREHTVVTDHRLEYEFLTRGFQLIGPDEATRAARAGEIDIDDPEGLDENGLRQLGKATGADWVVSAAIIDVRDDKNRGFSVFFVNRRAYAKIEIKVFDMHQDGYIENRFEKQSKTTVRALPGPNGIGTTGLFKQALDTTVQRSVANLLAPYPQTVHVEGEFDEDDLVDGQATPLGGLAPSNPAPVPAVPAVVAPPPPAQSATPTPAPALPAVPTRFVKKDGDVVTGIIDHFDAVNGLYFVKVPTGTTVVKATDVASMGPVPSGADGGAAAQAGGSH